MEVREQIASHLRAIAAFPHAEVPETSTGALYLDAQLATLNSTLREARKALDAWCEDLMREGK